MISNSGIKLVHSLKQKKARTEHGLFVAEGPRIVGEIAASVPGMIRKIYATPGAAGRIEEDLPEGVSLETVGQAQMKRMSHLKTPQEVLALVAVSEPEWDAREVRKEWSLVLDGIQDPGNLGTIIRTADWFGIPRIICSPVCADRYNPKTIQSTMGSFLRVQVFYRALPPLLGEFQGDHGFGIYGTFPEGDSLYETAFTRGGFIVLGNESRGISPVLLPLISRKVMIPLGPQAKEQAKGGVKTRPDSLNVAAAAAVICAEIRRR